MIDFLTILETVSTKEIIDIVVKLLGLPTAIVGVITLIYNAINAKKERRREAFKNRLAQVNKVRSTSTVENENKYKDLYNGKLARSYGLIIDKKWQIYDKEQDLKLKLLKTIKVQMISSEEKQAIINKIKVPSLKIYPNHRLISKHKNEQNFVYNYLKYADKKVYLFNGDLFACQSITKENDNLVFKIYDTKYYQFLNTCKSLELLYETKERNEKFKIDILDLTNRYAGIGINCLTIVKNVRKRTNPQAKRDFFLVHARNSNIIESPNKIHVVPAGSFQPITSLDNNKDDVKRFNMNMENTVYREFCEEIFHTNHMSEITSFKLLNESNDYQFCKEFLKVYYIGAGIEPYNTKMEVLALGIIDIDEIVNTKDEYKKEIVNRFCDEHKIDCSIEMINLDLLAKIIGNSQDVDYNSYEGEVKFERLSRAMFEQYYSSEHSTPSAKEIFGFMYENYDSLFNKD